MSYGDIHNSTGTICKARIRSCPLNESESGGHSNSIEDFVNFHENNSDVDSGKLKELIKEGLPPKDALELAETGLGSVPKARKAYSKEPIIMKRANGGNLLITPGVIDDNAIKLYKEGQCLAFAITLAERTGGKVGLVTYRNGTVVHAFSSKNGEVHDISGSLRVGQARTLISRNNTRAYESNNYENTQKIKFISPKKMRKLLESNTGAFKIGDKVGNISEQNFELAEVFVESYMNQNA